jgi:subtilisin family serine protease
MNRRTIVSAGLLLALFAVIGILELAGDGSLLGAATGNPEGCAAGPAFEYPEEVPAEIMTMPPWFEEPEIRRPGPVEPPSHEFIEGQFVIQLTPPALEGAFLEDDRLVTASPELDEVLEGLGAIGFEPVFPPLARMKPSAAERGLDRIYAFEADEVADVVLERLEALPLVEFIEPVMRRQLHETPDDPRYVYQWHFHMLDMERAWEITDGSDVVVAVIDTGVSAGEDGFLDLLPGYDYIDYDDDPADEAGHGSHVAGTIAQSTRNGLGVAGMAPGAAILPIRVCTADNCPSLSVARGIEFAVDNGAQVINMSLGGPIGSSTEMRAVNYALDAGVVVVASSGNDGFTDAVGYPAAFDGVIAVGAVDSNYEITSYSNQGEALDIVAPGGVQFVDNNGDGVADGVLQETFYGSQWGYYPMHGTSMASPHVAGLAALLIANGLTDGEEVFKAITTTASDLGDEGWDTVYGHGLIHPEAALYYPEDAPADGGGGGGGGAGGGGEGGGSESQPLSDDPPAGCAFVPPRR